TEAASFVCESTILLYFSVFLAKRQTQVNIKRGYMYRLPIPIVIALARIYDWFIISYISSIKK
ncbi:hypothetical protein ACGI6H_33250, partial [Escherichia coli]